MRVLMLSADPSLPDRGSASFARVRGYAEDAGEIFAVARTVRGSSVQVADGPLTVIPTASSSKVMSFWRLWRRARQVVRERGPFDLVTAQDPFEHGLIAWLVAFAARAPLELQAHTDFTSPWFVAVSRANRFRVRIVRFLVPRAASVRAVSARVANACRALGAPATRTLPVHAVTGPLLAMPLPPAWREGEASFDVVTVSRLSPEKRIENLIEAVRLARLDGVPARLTIVGDGPERARLEAAAGALEQGSVIFLGRLSSPFVGRYHVYAQASAYEGYGLSLLEAAARALPVITTDVGLVGEVLVDGESCLVAESPRAFAHAIVGLARNPDLAASLGAAARAAAIRVESARHETVAGIWRDIVAKRKPRLLVVTQALDRDDTVLGFFARWLDELAARSESVVAVCLRGGRYEAPANVRVRSLGKGEGRALPSALQRFVYAWRFKWLCLCERKRYDAVLVHMNEEYVLLSGLLWRLLGKKVTMWRNHYAGTWRTRLAGRLCHEVFCTSRDSYTASFGNVRLMPVGVPLGPFVAAGEKAARAPRSVLFLGRVAPSKNLDLGVEALGMLAARGVDFRATFVGDPLPEHRDYAASLRARVEALKIADCVEWRPGVPNEETPSIYAAHEIFVNPSKSGMFDKTMLEAAATGCRVVYSSEDARDLFAGAGFFPLSTGARGLADAIEASLARADGWSASTARTAVEAHSLDALADALAARLAC